MLEAVIYMLKAGYVGWAILNFFINPNCALSWVVLFSISIFTIIFWRREHD